MQTVLAFSDDAIGKLSLIEWSIAKKRITKAIC